MSTKLRTFAATPSARVAAVLAGLMLPAALGACSGDRAFGSAGSTVPTASDKGDVVGGGGRIDEIYPDLHARQS